MTRRLLVSYLGLVALVLVMVEVPFGITFARQQRAAHEADVRSDAEAIARFASGPLTTGEEDRIRIVAEAYQQRTDGRVVITDARGRAVADSEGRVGRDFSTRPEIRAALAGRDTTGFRYSSTLQQRLLFVAIPVDPDGRVAGTVRVTYPAAVADEQIRRAWIALVGVGIVSLAAAAVVGWLLARSVTRPVRTLVAAARRLGDGDLSARATLNASAPPEMRSLAAEINDAAARLDRLVRRQQDFVADASHQLRTPLTALRLQLEILEGSEDEDTEARAASALSEVNRLSRLVDGLLALARAEASSSRAAPIDLGEVLEDRRDSWAPLAEERDVTIVVHDAGGGTVMVTPDHLEQVLDNILANAIDVSPAGGRISMSHRDAGERVVLNVVDDGPGMDAEQREHAFDRFWRPDDRTTDGFGLGLAIAQRLLEVDGGTITLDAAPTGGLNVCISLPRA